MKPGSKQWKNFMAKLYGWGAAIVIIGALFKIQHWEGASLMLILGLGTEAFIFFMSAFEKPHEEPDWSLVYPQLATGEGADKTPTQQLDDMLSKASIDSNMITKLGDGMRHLGEQASKMGEVADASVAAKGYSDSLVKASNRVDELSSTYEEVSEGLTGLVKASAEGASTGAGLAKMNENLNSLNDMYEGQLAQMHQNRELFEGIGELMKNLNDSVEDTKVYKENISELAKNLASLNTVYGNMLNAMGGGRS
ncbi:MAG: gliding motility protein GldL [Bacteroidota bacterium]|mgnify:FL=1|jgi:gliding motility-associated protein GldL|nr:gliding motility protein GldL [Flavobacteriales bacterium]MEC7478107.1 gliding motility protein GldL [Bacteroidota bacterium]MEC8400481.1 gliding motility protein GldL [Bacteroidota bacterium]HBS19227.1 gliding motility protein GldL [Flavobacteriales bacterium]